MVQGTHRKITFPRVSLRLVSLAIALLIVSLAAFLPTHVRADATIVTHQALGPQIPVGQSGTLSVSCGSGEALLSGGFYGDAFEGAVYVTANYPSSPNTWTVTVNNNGGPSWVQMTVSVNCIQSTTPITTTIVHTTGSSTTVASCPTGSALVGGGYSGTGVASMSSPQGNGWQTNATDAYAVCATQGLTTDPSPSVTFNVPGASQNGNANVNCASGQLTTGGGFSSSGPTVGSQLGTGAWAVTVAGVNFNPGTSTAWAVCVSPSLTGSTPTVTTTPVSTPCQVGYTITSQWPGGFSANVVITNLGTTTFNNWTLTFSFANGQTITQLWNGSETQTGSAVTVINLSYNGTIAPGGNSNFGFNASWSGTNSKPASFTLNGAACVVA